MHFMHCCIAAKYIETDRNHCMIVFNEAMHLLPQSFVIQAAHSSSQGRLKDQRHSSSLSLIGSFRKACRTSSRGRLFRFWRPRQR
ncbi:hypothetical protein EMEDMD4_790418 [Sinorhizobium medicae]|uniref:Uncharacterized protein n=1 Tax=Sinorhizobium medicae TaxID=110321 RepID=A0A508X8U1_9HYPH|nr:hypothetical protein EMEDMD4_790418 [Sinorhizobium medicae]